jgi:hypothetical protein
MSHILTLALLFLKDSNAVNTKVGERLRSSFFVSLVSKPFQKYYQKAREGRSVHLDELLFAESVAAMRLPVSFTADEAAAVLPMMDSAGVADSMEDIVKPSTSMKGFLWPGFLKPSPAMKVFTLHTSFLESVVVSSTLDVKEDGVVRNPSPLGGCITPTVEKSDDFRVNSLSQSQKWPVGFGPFW